MCCGNVTWVHLHETITDSGILALWHNCEDSSFSLTAKHNWRPDAALGLPALFRNSNRDKLQIFRGTRPCALLRIHRLVGVSCFYQVSPNASEQGVRKRWPPFSEQIHDSHVALLSGNLSRATTTKPGS